MAIAVGSPKLAKKLQELRNLQRALASPYTSNSFRRRRQKDRLQRLQEEIRHLLAQ